MKCRYSVINTAMDFMLSQGKSVGMVFKTQDGKKRTMNIRPCPLDRRAVSGNGVSVDGIVQRPNLPNYRIVWDHNADGFRHVNLDTVSVLNAGGTQFKFSTLDKGAIVNHV